jgi:hypothetical protein
MLQLPLDQLLLILLQDALLLALILRIWTAGLYRLYPYFFSYLLAELARQAIMTSVPYRSNSFKYFWVSTEGVVACFYVLIVVELYRVILRDLPGIASISRRYITATLGIAILLSLLLLRVEEAPANWVSAFLVIERAVTFSLVFFILLVSAFLVYYPVPLNRNVIVYSVGYAVYFLTKATGLFVRTLGHYIARELSTVLLVISSLCLLYWAFALNRRGELRTVVVGHKWGKVDEEQLLAKLRTINASLIRTAKT